MMEYFGLEKFCIPIDEIGDGDRLMGLVLEALESREELGRRISGRFVDNMASFDRWIQHLQPGQHITGWTLQ
jgi:hypothetical protein